MKRQTWRYAAALVLLTSTAASELLLHAYPDCSAGPLAANAVCDQSKTITERATALIGALTLEEKVNITGNVSPGVPRVGLPPYHWWNEALHGVALAPGTTFSDEGEFSYATCFPQPYTMGAAFDDQLVRDVAGVISTEGRAFSNARRAGVNFWSPNLNPFRDPRWGRGQEVPSEDVYHTKQYGKDFIRGMQGDDPHRWKVMATCKHVAAYDLENWHGRVRYGFDATVSSQDLAEYYMQPFQMCVRDEKVASLMCSYNAINGTPACADPYLMKDIVRDHWDWKDEGTYMVSDCGAVRYAYSDHHFRGSREEMVTESLKSGIDIDCGYYYPDYLGSAVRQGLLSEDDINQALIRAYSGLIRTGFFDLDNPYRSVSWADVGTPEADQLALRIAEEGVVLLKNGGILPLQVPQDRNLTIAAFGSWMNATVEMQGNYQGLAKSIKSPLEALQALDNATILTANWQRSKYEFVQTVKPDVIVIADGNRLQDAMETVDRDLLEWHGEMSDVVSSLSGLGIPIVVINMGEQCDNGPYLRDDGVSAVLWAGYGGQAGGEALANILTGKAAPAGRLPVTQYPTEYVYSIDMTDMALRPDPRTGKPGRTYRWYDNATLPFGYGLHYTTFSMSLDSPATLPTSFAIADLIARCDTSKPLDLCPFHPFNNKSDSRSNGLAATVTNTGTTSSDFVALAFIAGEFGPQPYPRKTLVAYDRLHGITAGASQAVDLQVSLGGLARHDESGNQVLFPGKYRLLLDEPSVVAWEYELVGEEAVLDLWPQPRGAGAGRVPEKSVKQRVSMGEVHGEL